MEQDQNFEYTLWSRPETGTVLAMASGLSFFFLSMILSFVGPAGSKVPHAAENKQSFLLVLLLTFVLAALSAFSKLERRKIDGSDLPLFSFGLCGVCLLTLIIVLFDGFAI